MTQLKFPKSIWLIIFQELSIDDLQQCTMVCKVFYNWIKALYLPLLERTLSFETEDNIIHTANRALQYQCIKLKKLCQNLFIFSFDPNYSQNHLEIRRAAINFWQQKYAKSKKNLDLICMYTLSYAQNTSIEINNLLIYHLEKLNSQKAKQCIHILSNEKILKENLNIQHKKNFSCCKDDMWLKFFANFNLSNLELTDVNALSDLFEICIDWKKTAGIKLYLQSYYNKKISREKLISEKNIIISNNLYNFWEKKKNSHNRPDAKTLENTDQNPFNQK